LDPPEHRPVETLPERLFRQFEGEVHLPSPPRQDSARARGVAVRARRERKAVKCIVLLGRCLELFEKQ
jgi:hypothetical protein